jgi:hypothetical protein
MTVNELKNVISDLIDQKFSHLIIFDTGEEIKGNKVLSEWEDVENGCFVTIS